MEVFSCNTGGYVMYYRRNDYTMNMIIDDDMIDPDLATHRTAVSCVCLCRLYCSLRDGMIVYLTLLISNSSCNTVSS